MDQDELVVAHYLEAKEAGRLFDAPNGVLERLRTWDLFERWLPTDGTVYDVGGAAGVHAAWLAERGYQVELFDPVSTHIAQAVEHADSLPAEARFAAELGDARRIPRDDESADVVLLLGPLYHLAEPSERAHALQEARRLLKPNGVLIAAGISRFSWLMDAYRQEAADRPEIQTSITHSVATGHSQADPNPGSFWAYFHRPQELTAEITATGFDNLLMAGVEGFAWMLADLAKILDSPAETTALLDQLRSTESEPSLLGASAHLLVRATK